MKRSDWTWSNHDKLRFDSKPFLRTRLIAHLWYIVCTIIDLIIDSNSADSEKSFWKGGLGYKLKNICSPTKKKVPFCHLLKSSELVAGLSRHFGTISSGIRLKSCNTSWNALIQFLSKSSFWKSEQSVAQASKEYHFISAFGYKYNVLNEDAILSSSHWILRKWAHILMYVPTFLFTYKVVITFTVKASYTYFKQLDKSDKSSSWFWLQSRLTQLLNKLFSKKWRRKKTQHS